MKFLVLPIMIGLIYLVYLYYKKFPTKSEKVQPRYIPKSGFRKETADFEVTGGFDKVIQVAGSFLEHRKMYIEENCSIYDEITIKWDKNNPYSKRAIAIYHQKKQIGFVPEIELDQIFPIHKQFKDGMITEIQLSDNYIDVYVGLNFER